MTGRHSRRWSDAVTSQETARNACSHQNKLRNRFFPRASRESKAKPTMWVWIPGLQTCETIKFCCFDQKKKKRVKESDLYAQLLLYAEWSNDYDIVQCINHVYVKAMRNKPATELCDQRSSRLEPLTSAYGRKIPRATCMVESDNWNSHRTVPQMPLFLCVLRNWSPNYIMHLCTYII